MTPTEQPPVFVRRVRLEDAQTMQGFVPGLSGASRRNRFHGSVNGASPRLIACLVNADGIRHPARGTRHAAWAACIWGPDGEEIIGEAGFDESPDRGVERVKCQLHPGVSRPQ